MNYKGGGDRNPASLLLSKARGRCTASYSFSAQMEARIKAEKPLQIPAQTQDQLGNQVGAVANVPPSKAVITTIQSIANNGERDEQR